MKQIIFLLTLIGICIVALSVITAQTRPDFSGNINKHGEKPSIAVPDFRGAGDTQRFMATVNSTVFSELQNSGQLTMVAKTLYPLQIPQQPSDFHPPANGRSQRPWLTDCSGPPPNANYLAFGYAATQNNQLVLYGWLYDVRQANTTAAQLIGKIYVASIDEDGAKKVAWEFAADILKYFGAESLIGTKIYFVSTRTGSKEIWSMDYDGSNQKQFTAYRTITSFPTVSPDGTKIAFTTYPIGRGTPAKPVTDRQPQLYVHSLTTGRTPLYYT